MLRNASSLRAVIARAAHVGVSALVLASSFALVNCGSSGGGGGSSNASGGASSNGGGSPNGAGGSAGSQTGPGGAGGSTSSGPDLCAGVTCTASDACHVGTCDPSTGECSNRNAPDDTPCQTGQGCAAADGRIAGVCTKRDPSHAHVDQAQLTANKTTPMNFDTPTPGQTFTVGKAGWLTGIETSISADGRDTTNIRLDLFDAASNTKLASTNLTGAALGASPGGALSANQVGKAFFDLSSACLSVAPGQTLYFSLTVNATPFVPICNSDPNAPHVCLLGENAGKPCSVDSDCLSFAIVSATGNPYSGGDYETPGGFPDATQDLTFKTFVE